MGWLLVAPATALVVLFFIVPLGMAAWMSLHDWPLFGAATFSGLENYTRILEDDQFWRSMGFTALYTLVSTAVVFVIGFALAGLVHRPRRGVGVFRTAYFLPVVIGFAAASFMATYMLNSSVGIINKVLQDVGIIGEPIDWLSSRTWSLVAVVALTTWKTVGFTMLLLMAGMQGVNKDYYDAAKVDGAGAFSRFRLITLPLMRRSIALVLVLSIIAAFLTFEQFFILTGGGPNNTTITAVHWIYRSAFTEFRLGYGAALSMVLMVVLVAISAVQLRLLRDNVEE